MLCQLCEMWHRFRFIKIVLFFLSGGMLSVTPVCADAIDALLEDIDGRTVCEIHLDRKHNDAYLRREIDVFQKLAEEALALRAITIKVGRELKEKAEGDKPLSGEDLDIISFGLATHLELRKKLMAIAESHECWLSMGSDEMAKAGLVPQRHLEGIMLSLASALVMYDNYLLTATLFQGDPELRKLLNDGDQGYQIDKEELLSVSLSYNSVLKRARVRRAMKFYEKELASGKHSGVNQYLSTLIDQSPSYDMVREWSPLHVLNSKLGLYTGITADTFASLEEDGVSFFSMLFGNTIGLVETRKGKLFKRKDIGMELQSTLKSGDILLEKTPFRLTDKLIPGYWGHAAVWIGSEKELRGLGVWDDPLVKKYHKEIKAGNLVVEALRSGVEMNPLSRFLNIDSLGIVRRPDLTKEEQKKIVLQSLRQVGKSYDFNFDVESMEKVYCSKLIYIAYHGIDWHTRKSFGRSTFTPDDVAANIFSEDALELVTFYHDGRKIDNEPVQTLAVLMQETLE